MALKVCELVSFVLLMIVGGLYWGPWIALTRTIADFDPSVFLAVVKHLNRTMGPFMTVAMPLALLSTVPVLVLSFGDHRRTFSLTLATLVLFVLTLIVTLVVEVPIVQQMDHWTEATLPDDWQALRDRWGAFHLLRIVPALMGLVLFLVAVIW